MALAVAVESQPLRVALSLRAALSPGGDGFGHRYPQTTNVDRSWVCWYQCRAAGGRRKPPAGPSCAGGGASAPLLSALEPALAGVAEAGRTGPDWRRWLVSLPRCAGLPGP